MIITNSFKELGKMNIDEVIDWVKSVEGKNGKELAFLLKSYYKNRKDRFVNTTIIRAMFNEYFLYGADIFRSMECDVATMVQLIK